MKIKYGTREMNIDITSICFEKLLSNGIITIPSGNPNCDSIFGDPIYGIKKKIFKTDDDDNILEEFDDLYPLNIYIQSNPNLTRDGLQMLIPSLKNSNQLNDDLNKFYNLIKINHGTMKSEQQLHKICLNYLIGNEKILEIGGNIGRTTLFISSILNNYNLNDCNYNLILNLVTMECNLNMAIKLEENRELNNFNFHIEKSALSKKILIQKGPYETIASDTLKKGYEYVNVITYEQLKNIYHINFDTLIIDCDGGFYNILLDMPEILDDINLIIMKNDYDVLNKKIYIDETLVQYNFNKDYMQGGGWGACCNNFYEVWKKYKNN